jgi:hypothetical protein
LAPAGISPVLEAGLQCNNHVLTDVRGREAMNIRVDVATAAGSHGLRSFSRLQRDTELDLSDGDSEREFRQPRNAAARSIDFEAGLRGEIGRYPFDSYATRIVVNVKDVSAKEREEDVPIRLTVWEGVAAWTFRVTNVTAAESGRSQTLAFELRRPAPLIFFACVMYGVMGIIAIVALVIGSLVLIGKRRVEITIVGALTAMVFALPILRNALPGAPPLGVFPDIVVFLWAEVAVTIALALFVAAWVRRGPAP